MIIGIDFGTCFSHVSVILSGKVLDDVVVDSKGENLIPSQYLNIDGKEYFGNDAIDEAKKRKISTIKGLKTEIRGMEFKLKDICDGNADNLTCAEVLARMLGYLINLVKKCNSEKIEYIAIAAPVSLNVGGGQNAEYNYFLKDTLKKLTGLDDEHIFVKDEPVMGAYSYICNNRPKKDQTILVFDLGGGTLDTSIVKYHCSDDEMEVVTTDGIEIGGNKWTNELSKYVKTVMSNKGISKSNYPPNLDDEVEKLKRKLSEKDSAFFIVKLENFSEKITVKRDEFEIQTGDLLEACKFCVLSTMKKIDIHPDDIDIVVLVGGSSRMPQIRNMFLEFPGINESKIISHSPDMAISNGAVLYLKRYNKKSGGIVLGPVIKEHSSHTYGVEVSNAYVNAPMIKNIIFKGEEFIDGNLYRSPDCTFHPESDEINHVLFIKVYESNCLKTDCDEKGCVRITKGTTPLGKPICIPIPERYATNSTKYCIRIGFNLTSSNILTVKVSEASSGRLLLEKAVNYHME